MPLFMDMHSIDGGVAVKDVREAHLADLQAQDQYGVRYLRYWVDEAGGRIFRSTQRVIQRCLEDHRVRFVSCQGESGVMVRDVDGPENHDRAA